MNILYHTSVLVSPSREASLGSKQWKPISLPAGKVDDGRWSLAGGADSS